MASPRVINPQVQVPGSRQGEGRVGRRPETHFELRFLPYQIQPMCLFPVLPGETLMNCNLQTQMWSDPLKPILKNQVWHAEFYLYYCKFRDLPGWEASADGLGKDLIDMIESGEALTPNVNVSGSPVYGCPPGGVDYVQSCLSRVVESYWREEGETSGSASVGGVPIAAASGSRRDVMDKLTAAVNYQDRRQALDWDGSGTITVDDIEMAYREWIGQKDGAELDMDFEDWVRAAGGKALVKHEDREELHLPEELLGVREFTYPTNTVEPTTGTPSSAVGWRWKKGQRKMFRFEEWGWLLGVFCVRPKLLTGNQSGLFADMMQTRDHWFPPNMDPRSWQPHMNVTKNTGPLSTVFTTAVATDYMVNLRDLLRYGEQFTNFAPTAGDGMFATLPTVTQLHYPSTADVSAPFADIATGRIRASGVIQIGMKTHKSVVSSEEPESLALSKW